MQKGYIKQTTDAKKVQASINALNEAGIASSDIAIAEDFVAVLDDLNKGDTLFIHRFADICNSLPAVFLMIEQFCAKGVDIYSIEDWWISERTAENFLPISRALNALNSEIVSNRTKQGLQQRVKDGGRLGRELGAKNKPKMKTTIIKKTTKLKLINKKVFILTAMLMIGSLTYSFAQNARNVLSTEVIDANHMIFKDTVAHQVSEQVLFRIGNSTIDPSYMGNAQRLEKFVKTLKSILSNPNYVVSRIEVVGTASPDGKELRNITLAGERAEALAKYLQLHTAVSSDKIEVVNGGENWGGLRMMIEESKDMPYRDAMLRLINIPDVKSRKHQMMFYADSKPWLWMYEHFFNSLRNSSSSVDGNNHLDSIKTDNNINILGGSSMSISYKLKPESEQCDETYAQQQAAVSNDSIAMTKQPVVESSSPKPFKPFIALKTDLMLWGGVMPDFSMGTWTPNLSAEIYFSHRWSAQAGYAYSNWNKFTGTKELYAVSVADLEVRHWFSKPSQFKGFYLGVYGQYGQYDVQKDIQGQTGSFWSAGLGAGWMQPLSRHWALEVEIRGGYRSAQNSIYDIEQGHTYFNTKQTIGKFTPQFRLQVVYRIGKTQK